jgi:type VI secretion system (T6SS) immunity protein Tdi1
MYEAFQRDYPSDLAGDVEDVGHIPVPSIPGLFEFLRSFGGASFQGGVYRAVHPKDLEQWRQRVGYAFPQFEKRIVCFGYDWLGSAFALDFQRLVDDQPGVVIFEPGTGQALDVPANILTFHNAELAKSGEAVLAASFFKKWLGSGGAQPAPAQCVGYKKPLFLGGKDIVENLEISDIDVYWHLMGQLIRRVRGLPEGTPIRIGNG